MLTGQRYSESYCSGVAVTVPSLLAAAALTSAGACLWNFSYVAAIAAGPDLMKGFAMVCKTVKAKPRGSIGEASVKATRAKAAFKYVLESMMIDAGAKA